VHTYLDLCVTVFVFIFPQFRPFK